MRYRPIQAALLERVPFKLWSPTRARTLLATVAASAAALVPAVMIASPAQAEITGLLTITPVTTANWEGSTFAFTATYTGASPSNAVTFSAGGSSGPSDFAVSPVTVGTTGSPTYTFPGTNAGGTNTVTVYVQTVADNDVTPNETFTLTGTEAVTTHTVVSPTATMWDTPTSNAVTLTGPSTVAESAGTAIVTANTTTAQTHEIDIPVYSTDGTANSTQGVNRDYTALATNATIVIPAGQLSGSVTVPINDNSVYEGTTPNTFSVTTQTIPGANASGTAPGTTGSSSLTVGIQDNDTKPTVSLGTPNAVNEGSTMAFPITLSNPSNVATTVHFVTSVGDSNTTANPATNGAPLADYTPVTDTVVTIPAYATSYNKLVTVGTDANITGPQTIKGTISNPTGLTLGTTASANGVINDAQTAQAATLSTNGQSLSDNIGTSTTFTEPTTDTTTHVRVTLAPGTTSYPTKVDYSFVDGTAKNGVDYVGTAGTVSVAAGATTALIPVTIKANSGFVYPNETFKVALTSSNGTLGSTTVSPQTITISNASATAPTWTVDATATGTKGTSGMTTVNVPVTLSAPLSQDQTLTASVVSGTGTTAVSGGTNPGTNDYTLPTSLVVTIPAGQTTANLPITINGEAYWETDKTLTLSFSPTSGPLSGSAQTSVVTIKSGAPKPVITFNETTATEGSTIRVYPTVTNAAAQTYTFTVNVGASGTGPTDATPGTDFEPSGVVSGVAHSLPLTYTINPSTTLGSQLSQGYVSVYLDTDSVDEPTETFKATATESTSPLTGITAATGMYKINDDPSTLPPTATIGNVTVDADATTANVPVTLTMQGDTTSSTQAYSVHYSTIAGTATAGTNFVATTGTLTIPAGTMSGTIPVKIVDDKMKRADDSFVVKLDTPMPVGAAISGDGMGTVTIHSTATATAPTIMAPASVKGGEAARISGMADAGSTVWLWVQPFAGGNWVKGPSTMASSTGAYSFSRMLTSGENFKVSVDDLTSDAKSVWVQQAPSLIASSPKKGYISVTAGGNPMLKAGEPIVVQKGANGLWVTGWTGKAATNGRFMATAAVKTGTLIAVRTYVPGDAKNGILPGYTAAIWVRIK